MPDVAHAQKLLESESASLFDLAEMSGFDPFEFYQGSDLSGLDLTGQDLSGLNFDRANLRGAKIDGVTYEVGAFNLSVLDEKYEAKRDKYRLYFDDILTGGGERIGGYGAFRPGFIDIWKKEYGINYRDIAAYTEMSESTLRKARYGHWVLMTTVDSIARGLLRISRDFQIKPSITRQPSIAFGGAEYAGFEGDNRSQFLQCVQVARAHTRAFLDRPNREYLNYRISPSYYGFLYRSWLSSDYPILVDYLREGNPFGMYPIDQLMEENPPL